MHEFSASHRYPNRCEPGVWVVWCFRVRAGHGGKGVAQALLGGAVEYARTHGARAVEGFPVDNGDERVDRTLASFGVRSMFGRAGFTKVAELAGRRGGFPQPVMRVDLGEPSVR
jgi:GNAT superfamily N-acetyltransferase